MLKTCFAIFLAIAGIVMSKSCFADGAELLKRCQTAMNIMDGQKNITTVDTLQFGQCTGYVRGAADALIVMELPNVCWPESEISNGQGVRILLKYLKNNPEKLHKPEILLTMLAFSDAFPCE